MADLGIITLTVEEYAEMQERLAWLDSLEQAGVDNWQGIDFAYELHNEGKDEHG